MYTALAILIFCTILEKTILYWYWRP